MSITRDGVQASGRVLVVDDELPNRELLRGLLEAKGHSVTEAVNGCEALALAAQVMPHAILLDIMMPEMDGFEVCRQLKANPVTAPIPVLMVTALSDRDDRLKGIEVGASDFLSKPVDTRDVELRTRNAIHSKQLYDQLQESLLKLQKLERLRDNLTHMIVHDMRSPLQSISGNLELLEMSLGESVRADDRSCLQDALSSAGRLIEMVSSLLDVSRMEAGQMPLNREVCDLGKVAEDAVKLLGGLFTQSPVVLEIPPVGREAFCDKMLVQRVISNLLGNAAKYSPSGSEIKLSIQRLTDAVKVLVIDQGSGIPPEYHAQIFEKFGQVDLGAQRTAHSTGLGLTFCKLAVEQHGGQIGVESVPGHGSTFWFTLPLRTAGL